MSKNMTYSTNLHFPGSPGLNQQQYQARNAAVPSVPVPAPYAGHPPPLPSLVPAPGQPPVPYGYPINAMGGHNPNHIGMIPMLQHRAPILPPHLQPPAPHPLGGHYAGVPPPPQHAGSAPPPPPQQPQPPLPPGR